MYSQKAEPDRLGYTGRRQMETRDGMGMAWHGMGMDEDMGRWVYPPRLFSFQSFLFPPPA